VWLRLVTALTSTYVSDDERQTKQDEPSVEARWNPVFHPMWLPHSINWLAGIFKVPLIRCFAMMLFWPNPFEEQTGQHSAANAKADGKYYDPVLKQRHRCSVGELRAGANLTCARPEQHARDRRIWHRRVNGPASIRAVAVDHNS